MNLETLRHERKLLNAINQAWQELVGRPLSGREIACLVHGTNTSLDDALGIVRRHLCAERARRAAAAADYWHGLAQRGGSPASSV